MLALRLQTWGPSVMRVRTRVHLSRTTLRPRARRAGRTLGLWELGFQRAGHHCPERGGPALHRDRRPIPRGRGPDSPEVQGKLP